MKILHLGDLHIGKNVNDFSMIADQEYILDQILQIIKDKDIDAVVMAGDIYDKSIPSEDAVRVFNGFIEKLAVMKTPALLISGNHDSAERLNFASSLLSKNGIYISSKYSGELMKVTLEDRDGPVNFYLMPYIKASRVKQLFPEEEILSYDDAVRVVIANEKIDRSQRNILIAHQFVTGKGKDPKTGGSESMSCISVGDIEKINSASFEDFDYVALGHIHSPQRVGKETIRYSGSPLKYSLSEVNDEKSVPVVTLSADKETEVELVPLKPLKDMRHLKGRLLQILEKTNITDPDDYIYVTLTDEDPVPDAAMIIRQYYPNLMKIDYDNSHTKGAEITDITRITRDRSFEEVISDFYSMIYGCDISPEEMEIMQSSAREAGILK